MIPQWEEILESFSDGVIVLDGRSHVLFSNHTACQIFGVFPEDLLGRSLHSIETKRKTLALTCHTIGQQTIQLLEPIRQVWEEGISYELIATPLMKQGGAVLVMQGRKLLQAEENFVANAAHELRTPVTVIRGFAELLQDSSCLKEKWGEIGEKIVRMTQRLERLIQSLLVFSNLKSLTQEQLQKVDLVELSQKCSSFLKMAHSTAQVDISTSLQPVFVAADPYLLDLAMMNLLENGVKYSPGAAQLEMKIYSTKSTIHLEIRDRGIGISEGDLPHIFDRFYMVDRLFSRKLGGVGLGLSLVKAVMARHGGTVSVSSQLGVGSCFLLSFPVIYWNKQNSTQTSS